jgi:hypothetical protein
MTAVMMMGVVVVMWREMVLDLVAGYVLLPTIFSATTTPSCFVERVEWRRARPLQDETCCIPAQA